MCMGDISLLGLSTTDQLYCTFSNQLLLLWDTARKRNGHALIAKVHIIKNFIFTFDALMCKYALNSQLHLIRSEYSIKETLITNDSHFYLYVSIIVLLFFSLFLFFSPGVSAKD